MSERDLQHSSNLDVAVLNLDRDLTAAGAEILRGALSSAAATGKRVLLDGSQTEIADFACFQILCAAFRDADQTRSPLGWTATSPFLRTMATRLGITSVLHIGLPAVAAGTTTGVNP